ncbi:MAG TPA: hypothetical protein VGC78_00485 [Gaiellaceae bacterium]
MLALAVLAAAPAAGARPAAWQQALHARSVALDERYGLGRFAVPASAAVATTPAWLRALEVRGRAMNARYHLGAFEVRAPSTPFRWRDAAIGAAFTAALVLLAAAALLIARRAHPRVTSSA